MIQERFIGTVDKPDKAYYADPPAGFVKLFYHHTCGRPDRAGFFRCGKSEFERLKEVFASFSSLPKGCGAQYVVVGDYPVAQEFMLEGSQYTGPRIPIDWASESIGQKMIGTANASPKANKRTPEVKAKSHFRAAPPR